MGWISVKLMLPKNYDGICVVTDGMRLYLARFWRFPEENLWVNISSGYKVRNVTHWMPLPDPPKE